MSKFKKVKLLSERTSGVPPVIFDIYDVTLIDKDIFFDAQASLDLAYLRNPLGWWAIVLSIVLSLASLFQNFLIHISENVSLLSLIFPVSSYQ